MHGHRRSFVFALTLGLVLLGFSPGVALAEETPTQPAPRPMTVEDLWEMERVSGPTVSPDGRWIVFTVTRYSMDDNKGDSDLWVVPTDGSAEPRRLTWSEGSDSSPAWSPDGRQIAFVSSRGEGPGQLHLLPFASGGEARPVTDLPFSPSGIRWFPDGRRIAFAARTWPDLNDDFEAIQKRLDEHKDDPVQAKISDTRLLRFWDHYRTNGRVGHLFEVDVETGEARDLTPGEDWIFGFGGIGGNWDLSPDGKEIVLSANTTEAPYQSLNFDLFLLSLEGEGAGSLRRLTEANPAGDYRPRYTPDGRYIVYGRNDRPEVHPDFDRLARYDRQSGEIVGLAADWDGQPQAWDFSPDGRQIFFHAQERGRMHVFSLPIDGGTPRRVAEGGVTGGVEAIPAEDGGIAGLAFRRESLFAPAELFVVPPTGGESRALTDFNGTRLAELDLGSFDEITFAGADGDPVHMMLVLPPGFDRSKKYPLLHAVHGGPHGAFMDGFHYRWNMALFAAPGRVVAAVNFHGSTGYGQAFAESILGDHASKPFEDIQKATDRLLEEGYVDPARMAAAGGSYGGYMVSWILGHTDRFAALINHAGVFDLRAQFASDMTFGRDRNYGASPWTDVERVDLYSPSRYAKEFRTPTLILHGKKDYRVPYTQGVNLYGILQAKGVPSRIVIFPDENHWILAPKAAVVWWREVDDWLERYIGTGPTVAVEE